MARSAVILGCEGLRLTPDEYGFFAKMQPVGFILFARNIESPGQVRALCAELRDTVGRAVPVFIDQEGGRVQRLRAPHWREWQPPLDQIALVGPDHAARSMYLRALLIANEHRALGISANCAPLADIARPETHVFLRNRCYGEELETVTRCARAVADGLRAGGVLPVLKHIPGHGLGQLDSHLELPVVGADHGELAALDFAAFKALNDLPFGMTAHINYRDIDPENPATLSPRMIRLIREEIGFGGILMTDDLSMQALPGDMSSRAARAREAGVDLVLHCNGELEEMRAVTAAAGQLSQADETRLDQALASAQIPGKLDILAADAEFDAIMRNAGSDGGHT